MKDTLIKVRITTKDKESLRTKARKNGLDLSTYIRQLIDLDQTIKNDCKGGCICKQETVSH